MYGLKSLSTGGGWQVLGHWQYLIGTTDIVPSNSGVVQIERLKIKQTTQDGYVLTSDANGNASWKTASSGGSGYQAFTSPGTYLFTVPNDVNMVYVTAIAGGGGGGGGADPAPGDGGYGGRGGSGKGGMVTVWF